MKKLSALLIAALGLSLSAWAEDVKLEGDATCAKCTLKTAEKCQAAIQVKTADGKVETYLAEPGGEAKELHSEICKSTKAVKVEGTVTEKDGKKTIKIAKYEAR